MGAFCGNASKVVPTPNVKNKGEFSKGQNGTPKFQKIEISGKTTAEPDNLKTNEKKIELGNEVFLIKKESFDSKLSSPPLLLKLSQDKMDSIMKDSLSGEEDEVEELIYKKAPEIIGHGVHGVVMQCLNMSSGEILAVKTVYPDFTDQIRDEIKRIDLCSSAFSHQNLLKYYKICINDEHEEEVYDIVTEYVAGSCMRNLLNRFGKFEERVISLFLKQILEGLAHLHSKGFSHRNLKSSNVLLEADGTVKLSDVCILPMDPDIVEEQENNPQDVSESEMEEKRDRIYYWAAPEVMFSKKHSDHSDIWSVGCLLVEMITGSPVWSKSEKASQEIFQFLKNGGLPEIPICSDKCYSFLKSCLVWNPAHRCSASELLNLPFIKESTSDSQGDSSESFSNSNKSKNVSVLSSLFTTMTETSQESFGKATKTHISPSKGNPNFFFMSGATNRKRLKSLRKGYSFHGKNQNQGEEEDPGREKDNITIDRNNIEIGGKPGGVNKMMYKMIPLHYQFKGETTENIERIEERNEENYQKKELENEDYRRDSKLSASSPTRFHSDSLLKELEKKSKRESLINELELYKETKLLEWRYNLLKEVGWKEADDNNEPSGSVDNKDSPSTLEAKRAELEKRRREIELKMLSEMAGSEKIEESNKTRFRRNDDETPNEDGKNVKYRRSSSLSGEMIKQALDEKFSKYNQYKEDFLKISRNDSRNFDLVRQPTLEFNMNSKKNTYEKLEDFSYENNQIKEEEFSQGNPSSPITFSSIAKREDSRTGIELKLYELDKKEGQKRRFEDLFGSDAENFGDLYIKEEPSNFAEQEQFFYDNEIEGSNKVSPPVLAKKSSFFHNYNHVDYKVKTSEEEECFSKVINESLKIL